jgi:hypothetical protein
MLINAPWIRLTPYALESVPRSQGVYELATLVRSTVYVGRTADRDLRSCLADEITDPRREAVRRQAQYFRYEATSRDEARQRELLEDYRRSHHGLLPPGNLERDDPAAAREAEQPDRRGLRLVSSAHV